MQPIRRKPYFTNDTTGHAIVLVPLANHPEPAIIDPSDFERLHTLGIGDQWTRNCDGKGRGRGYVRCKGPHGIGLITIARIVAGAGAGENVKYSDGDSLNLRADNLVLVGGRSKAREASLTNRARFVTETPSQQPMASA